MLVDREVTVRLLQGRPVFLNANEKNIGLLFLKKGCGILIRLVVAV